MPLKFSLRLDSFMKKHQIKGAKLARRLGVSPSHISMLLSGKTQPSNQFVKSLEHLERDLEDPFLAACATILQSDDDRVVSGFTMNIYSVLGNVNRKEAERLKEIEEDYLEARKQRKRARDAG